jgi:hypothetical protein
VRERGNIGLMVVLLISSRQSDAPETRDLTSETKKARSWPRLLGYAKFGMLFRATPVV